MLLDKLDIRHPKDWEYHGYVSDPSPDFGDTYRFEMRPQTQLVQQIIELNKQFEMAVSRSLGMNSTDASALGFVMMAGPQSPTEIAKRLQISTAAVTTVVDRLETAGHVSREGHPTDRRAILVAATPESVERALQTLMPIAMAIDGSLDQFDDGERSVIQRYLETVVERQQDALPLE